MKEALEEIAVLEHMGDYGEKRAISPLTHGYIRLAFTTENPEHYRKARYLALRLIEEDGDVQAQIVAQCDLAYGAQIAWNTAHARSDYREVEQRARDLGFVHFQIVALTNLGVVEREVGHADSALAIAKEVRAFFFVLTMVVRDARTPSTPPRRTWT